VDRDLLTIPEACQLLNVSHPTVYRWIRAGELPMVKFGRLTRVRKADVEAFIAAHTERAPRGGRRRRTG